MNSGRGVVLAIAASMALAACSWNATDRALFASYAAFSTIDAWQTSRIKDHGFREGNPLFATEDGTPDMTRVIVLKTVGTGLIFWLLDQAENGRREVLYFANALQGGVVVWNQYWMWKHPAPAEPSLARRMEIYYCPQAALAAPEPMLALCERANLAPPDRGGF